MSFDPWMPKSFHPLKSAQSKIRWISNNSRSWVTTYVLIGKRTQSSHRNRRTCWCRFRCLEWQSEANMFIRVQMRTNINIFVTITRKFSNKFSCTIKRTVKNNVVLSYTERKWTIISNFRPEKNNSDKKNYQSFSQCCYYTVWRFHLTSKMYTTALLDRIQIIWSEMENLNVFYRASFANPRKIDTSLLTSVECILLLSLFKSVTRIILYPSIASFENS